LSTALQQYVSGRYGNQPDTSQKAVSVAKDPFAAFGLFGPDSKSGPADYRKWMREEPAVKAPMRYKIAAALARGWEITPASDDPDDLRRAAFIRDQFQGMRGGGNHFLRRCLWAYPLGWSVHEMELQEISEGDWAGMWGLRRMSEKKPETFRITAGKYGEIEKLEQRAGTQWHAAEDLTRWLDYLVIFMPDHDGDWKPHSDLEAAKAWVIAKGKIVRFWQIFCERHAVPTPKGKAPPGAQKEDMDELGGFLAQYNQHSSIVLPNGWEVDLLETARRGSDEYQQIIDYIDKMIRMAALVPSLTTEEGQRGAYSLGAQHAENFRLVLEEVGEDLTDVINDQLIRMLVRWNFGDDRAPRFTLNPFPDVDLEAVAKTMALLVEKGVVPADDPFVRSSLGLPELAEGTPVKQAKPGEGADHAAPSGLSPLRHASKANFTEYVERLDHARTWVRKKGLVESRDVTVLDKLAFGGVGDLRAALTRLLGHSVHQGVSDAQDEIVAGLAASGGGELPDLGERQGNSLFAEGDLESFADFAAVSDVEEFWRGKVPIQRDLLKAYNRRAFTISGVHRDRLLRESKDLIERAITRGGSYREIEQGLADLFNPYLEIQGAVDPGLAAPYRIQTIVRTNLSEAYNTGRMNLYRHPEVEGFVEAYEYSAVMDDRVTDFCASWHGRVVRASEVGNLNPPNHYRCRSVLIPVVTREKFELSKTLPSARVPAGFNV